MVGGICHPPRWRGSVTRANTDKEKIQEIVSFLLNAYLIKNKLIIRKASYCKFQI